MISFLAGWQATNGSFLSPSALELHKIMCREQDCSQIIMHLPTGMKSTTFHLV